MRNQTRAIMRMMSGGRVGKVEGGRYNFISVMFIFKIYPKKTKKTIGKRRETLNLLFY